MKKWNGVDRRGESKTKHHYPDLRKVRVMAKSTKAPLSGLKQVRFVVGS